MSQTHGGRGGARQRKSRIVIDVAQAQAEARARRTGRFGRRARVLTNTAMIALGIALFTALAAYAYWTSYTKGPAYSLALLADAARRDDMQTVESFIDSGQIAQGFVPQIIDKLSGGAVQLPPGIQRAQLPAAIPLLIPRLSETMRDEIARTMKALLAEAGESTSVPLIALGISRAAEIREGGDAATVSLKFGERPVELSMRRDGERWKLVGVKDDVLATDIAARLAANLPQQPTEPPRRRGR